MKQKTVIETMRGLLPEAGVEGALVVGAFGRGEGTVLSEIELQITVAEDFSLEVFQEQIRRCFAGEVGRILWLAQTGKLAVYLGQEQLLLQVSICPSAAEIGRDFYSPDIDSCILLDTTGSLRDLLQQRKGPKWPSRQEQAEELIAEFLHRFERCSTAHACSDCYKFYVFYNLALDAGVRIRHLLEQGQDRPRLPANFLLPYMHDDEQRDFARLCPTTCLAEANAVKRKLLDFFYGYIERLPGAEVEQIKNFCENVYARDELWNFRDAGRYHPGIKAGVLYRSSSLTPWQCREDLLPRLQDRGIRLIVDLRADSEVQNSPYRDSFISHFRYLRAALDPRHKDSQISDYATGTVEENSYKFVALEGKPQIKAILEAIADNLPGAALVHCHAGKDRTGVIVALICWLAGSLPKYLDDDYLASGANTALGKLDAFRQIVEQQGGIYRYVQSCGVCEEKMRLLIRALRAPAS